MNLLKLLSLAAGVLAGAETARRVVHHRQPRPTPGQLAGWLDHPLRLRYRVPADTLGPFGFVPGMTALDLGCGTGLFTVEMARLVGNDGVVHAVDLQPALLERARSRITAAGLANRVRFHQAGAYHLPLPDNSLDLAVLIATLTEVPDRLVALNELRRTLKPGARLALSEELPHGGYTPAFLVRRWLRQAGFRYGGQQGSSLCYSLLYFNEK